MYYCAFLDRLMGTWVYVCVCVCGCGWPGHSPWDTSLSPHPDDTCGAWSEKGRERLRDITTTSGPAFLPLTRERDFCLCVCVWVVVVDWRRGAKKLPAYWHFVFSDGEWERVKADGDGERATLSLDREDWIEIWKPLTPTQYSGLPLSLSLLCLSQGSHFTA